MKILTLPLMTLAILVSSNVVADTVLLTDNQTLKGKVISLDQSAVQFELGGQQLKFERSKIKSITFDHSVAQKPVAQVAATPQVAAVQANTPVVIPANTPMMVKMNSAVNSSKHKAGHKFTAKLEAAIVVNKNIVIPKGTDVYGVISESKQSSRLAGSSNVSITFTQIMLNDQLVAIHTSGIKAISESTTKQTVRRTARFAAIGGLANGSKGAENAAKAGLGLSLLTSGSTVNIPAGTLLEFSLMAPLAL